MKLNEIRPQIETSGELEEQFFSIQDQGMIFDILRNKMYSNPILAICREISCNARDAHREVGKAEVPIQIHLPNALEPFYKIKDFGPGISPDRMSNIFIKYTASTKRSDNLQTGGFGLGAKTPFSYSDTFTILTNYNGVQYNYACFIDETKVGKLALLSETPTSEPNGTEIIIPVKPADFNAFIDYTEKSTRHWTILPNIKGGHVNYNTIQKLLEGNGWAITATHDYNRYAKMIIDGIEYPLELDILRKYADGKLIDACQGNFLMYFGVGELSLSASREQIYLDKTTQDKIRQRLNEIYSEIRQRIEDKINTFTNLWDVCVYYRTELRRSFHDLRCLGTFSWNGIQLDEGYVNTICPVYVFTKGKYSRKHGTDPNKLSRSLSHHINFIEHSALFVNDLPLKEPTPRRIKKAFDDDNTLQSLQLICPTDKVTVDELNKKIHLDQMSVRQLSSITKASARSYTPASSRLVLFKFDPRSCAFRQVSYASVDDDTNRKVLCKLEKDQFDNNRSVVLKNGTNFGSNLLRTILNKIPNVSIYGLSTSTPDKRIEDDFSDFESMEEFTDDAVLNSKTLDYVAIKFACENRRHFDEIGIRNLDTMSSLIVNQDSYYLKRLRAHLDIKKLCGADDLLTIYEKIKAPITSQELAKYVQDHPEHDLNNLDDEYKKKYPLLPHIDAYQYSRITDEIANYVNLIDKL